GPRVGRPADDLLQAVHGLDLTDLQAVGVRMTLGRNDARDREGGQGGDGVVDLLDLQPGHGHGLGDLIDLRLGIEVGLQPGKGELHWADPAWDSAAAILSRNSDGPVKPTPRKLQLMNWQFLNGIGPVTRCGPIGVSIRLRGSPLASPMLQPSKLQPSSGSRTAGPSISQFSKRRFSMTGRPARAVSMNSWGSHTFLPTYVGPGPSASRVMGVSVMRIFQRTLNGARGAAPGARRRHPLVCASARALNRPCSSSSSASL